MASSVSAIAYETVTDTDGRLPLLTPMSEVAGRMAPQVAAHFLERPRGGRGILLSGIEGLPAANVLVLGGGIVGLAATRIAIGMGADVTVVGRSAGSLRRVAELFGSAVRTVHSKPEAVHDLCVAADAVIAGALVPGAMAPKLISARTITAMKPGSVLVDVSIDQGGCAETSRPTTHAQPTYVVDGVVHYCVANMPGAVPRTSTFALNRATQPFILALADKGLQAALRDDAHLRAGLNVHEGKITCAAVADALGLSYVPAVNALDG
jgi:alanine dehydrogenase